MSRGRHEWILAPRNNVTLEELRCQRPQEQQSAIPQEVLEFSPGSLLQCQRHVFVDCLKSAPSGSAPGPGGCTYEVLRVCLDDHETLDLLCSAAEDFARAQPPHDVMRTFMLANITALQKKDGGVRGIATGTSFKRLVSKTLARQFMTVVEETCAPFQFAAIRAATDADHEATVLSPDVDDLGPDVWHGEGIKVLGTSVGSDVFVQSHTNERLEEENRLWEAIGWVPDAQCTWQILVQRAGPRCHHLLRTMSPSQSALYSAGHDAGMRKAMRTILGRLPGDFTQQNVAELQLLPASCVWVDWDSVLPTGRLPQRIGLRGPMPC